jgi:hypothetical protein
MTGTQYAIAAYVAGLGLMLLYGLSLWVESRSVARRRRKDQAEE